MQPSGTTQNMANIWKSKGLSMDLKVRFLKVTIFSIATYLSESWAMTKRQKASGCFRKFGVIGVC